PAPRYATTIHGAQGVSSDTMHGLLTGQESRQQLYTMLTRGRHANPLYLQGVGEGDPPTVSPPEPTAPCRATSPIKRPDSSRQFSAPPTASTSQPNNSPDPRPSQSSTRPTTT